MFSSDVSINDVSTKARTENKLLRSIKRTVSINQLPPADTMILPRLTEIFHQGAQARPASLSSNNKQQGGDKDPQKKDDDKGSDNDDGNYHNDAGNHFTVRSDKYNVLLQRFIEEMYAVKALEEPNRTEQNDRFVRTERSR